MSSNLIYRRSALVGVLGLAALPALAQPPEATAFWISFQTGSTQLHQQDLDTIKSVANYMKQYPDLMATIEGKTDTVGTPEFNDRLSEKRTIAVFDALVYVNGIPASRTHMHWTGERLPNVPTDDQQAELQNRVVMITLR